MKQNRKFIHKPPTWRILVHDKGTSSYWGKDWLLFFFFNQMVLSHGNWITTLKNIKLDSLLTLHTRINSTLIEDLNIKIFQIENM